MDEVAVYARALSQADITAHYGARLVGSVEELNRSPGPVELLDCGGSGGTSRGMDFFTYASPKMKALAAAVLVLVLGLITAVVVLLTRGSDTDGGSAAVDVPEGYTTEVTVPTLAPNVPKPATERPAEAPPKIYAEGACADAFEVLRGLMTEYPSGLVLDEAGNTRLGEGIAGVNADCTTDLASAFQQQELMPWMNYAVPAGQ
jgi:hypothetical protein